MACGIHTDMGLLVKHTKHNHKPRNGRHRQHNDSHNDYNNNREDRKYMVGFETGNHYRHSDNASRYILEDNSYTWDSGFGNQSNYTEYNVHKNTPLDKYSIAGYESDNRNSYKGDSVNNYTRCNMVDCNWGEIDNQHIHNFQRFHHSSS